MGTIFDIECPTSAVDVGNTTIEVRAVGVDALVPIVAKSEILAAIFEGDGDSIKLSDLAMAATHAPEAVGAIIAAGIGQPGDEGAQKHARTLPVDAQITLCSEILRLTMPDGVGPFVERLLAAFGMSAEAADESESQANPKQSKSRK